MEDLFSKDEPSFKNFALKENEISDLEIGNQSQNFAIWKSDNFGLWRVIQINRGKYSAIFFFMWP